MFEFDTVSSSSPSDLARNLTQRSADGWEVVSIVGSGLEMTAFLRRVSGTSSIASGTTAASGSIAAERADSYLTPTAATSAADEPDGWGSTPATTSDNGWGTASSAATPEPVAASAATASAAATVPTSSSTSSVPQVPAGWYADPAGRYELRYWDGGQWTEHVARGGTQYTDPPVA
jgi:hypothetical protein